MVQHSLARLRAALAPNPFLAGTRPPPRSYFHMLFRMSLHLKISLVDMLYDKSLRITSAVRSDMGSGAIVNLQSNDAAKLWGLVLYLHVVWNGGSRAPLSNDRVAVRSGTWFLERWLGRQPHPNLRGAAGHMGSPVRWSSSLTAAVPTASSFLARAVQRCQYSFMTPAHWVCHGASHKVTCTVSRAYALPLGMLPTACPPDGPHPKSVPYDSGSCPSLALTCPPGPFQILSIMFLLVRIMHWGPAMAGLAVTVVIIPLTTLLGKALAKSRREQVCERGGNRKAAK